ncbi:hypothetical protein [Serratia fonticola]|uniref:Uncharacterized protein n=1 Tax=Serratia fonticola TaxID=47917 RepID=A0ABY9PJV8_SERFO|nr:hypothetical protein [Serratia fonticola]WMT13691.1 hypothetical protein RFB13_21100 [Serratia fonticola]
MMTARMPTTVFTVCVSMSDWTCCPDEHGSLFPNADLKAALEAMYISLNLCDLCDYYFDEIAVGTGDILVFTSSRFTETYFIADLYREMTDQLDTVTFYISCPHHEVFEQVKPYLRRFFDQANYQFAYEENSASMTVGGIIESQSGDTYCVIEETGYQQKVIFQFENFAN